MISFMAAVIPQPFLVDIAFQVYYNIIGIYHHTHGEYLGRTLLKKGLSPTAVFLNEIIKPNRTNKAGAY